MTKDRQPILTISASAGDVKVSEPISFCVDSDNKLVRDPLLISSTVLVDYLSGRTALITFRMELGFSERVAFGERYPL